MTWPWVALITVPSAAGAVVGVMLWLVYQRRKR